MSVVPGGIPDLADLVGRDEEVEAVLRSFHGHGALLTGDRRHGKTCLTRLVEHASDRAGHHVVRVSAERASLDDFVEALADAFVDSGPAYRREVDRWQLSVRAGAVAGERRSSPRSLDKLVRAALAAHRDELLVLSIDEIPVLAKSMEENEGGSGAALLHLLRRLRQEYSGRLVMVLCGSIGFHHVTDDALGAVNDVEKLPVGPLRDADAVYLARCLLLGEGIAATDEAAVGSAVARGAEGVPYYVHQLVKSLRQLNGRERRPVEPADVPRAIDAALTDSDDPWDLRHYRDRLPSYYGHDAELVAELLDIYAGASAPLSVDEANRLLGASTALETRPGRSALVRLVERLEADHYLARRGDASAFASELVRRAWVTHRRR